MFCCEKETWSSKPRTDRCISTLCCGSNALFLLQCVRDRRTRGEYCAAYMPPAARRADAYIELLMTSPAQIPFVGWVDSGTLKALPSVVAAVNNGVQAFLVAAFAIDVHEFVLNVGIEFAVSHYDGKVVILRLGFVILVPIIGGRCVDDLLQMESRCI
eukprot:5595299-Pleurochrysis_carterae.AAC.1